MKPLIIKSSDDSPYVHLNPSENKFEISGRSMPEDVGQFYEPVVNWIAEYSKNPNPESEFIFKMTFINSASSKQFFVIFKKINELYLNNGNVRVKWYYLRDDEDVKELGDEFVNNLDVPIEMLNVLVA